MGDIYIYIYIFFFFENIKREPLTCWLADGRVNLFMPAFFWYYISDFTFPTWFTIKKFCSESLTTFTLIYLFYSFISPGHSLTVFFHHGRFCDHVIKAVCHADRASSVEIGLSLIRNGPVCFVFCCTLSVFNFSENTEKI